MLKIQKSYMAKSADVQPDWHLIDADNKVLGKLATEVATILQGKHRATYTPHIPTGDFVVIVNAEKIHVSGTRQILKYITATRDTLEALGKRYTLSFKKKHLSR